MQQKTVLLAFEEDEIACYFCSALERERYRILRAGSLVGVMNALERYQVHMLITGEQLPGVSVTALLPLLRAKYDDMKVIVAMKSYSPQVELVLRPYKIMFIFPWPVSEELVRSVVSQGMRAA